MTSTSWTMRILQGFVAFIVVGMIAGVVGSADARSSVVVALRVRLGYGTEAGHTTNECKVRVPTRANGIAVLKAAQRNGCIDSYVLVRYSEGTRAGCINGVCETRTLAPEYVVGGYHLPYTAWDIWYPGEFHYRQRLEGFRAGKAKTLAFHYVPCLGGC